MRALAKEESKIRGQVPRKQGLKLVFGIVQDDLLLSEGKFQENKD